MRHPQLGDRAREIVTGHEGIIAGTIDYLWGCRQHLLHYRDKDDKPQSDWYDVGRLEVLEENVVAAIDYFSEADVGETDATERAAHRGADSAPPRIA